MNKFVLSLLIIGALNWLLVGLFEWDLVAFVFGGDVFRLSNWLMRVVYVLVGLSGLYAIGWLFDRNPEIKQEVVD